MIFPESLRPLAVAFFLSGIWNLFAASAYVFLIGTGSAGLPADRFSALFIALLLFTFAYLEILSSFNIRQYLLVVGGVTIGRVLYVILLFSSILFVKGFPADFWWTGVIDLLWSVLYLVLAARSSEIRVRDLFLPRREAS